MLYLFGKLIFYHDAMPLCKHNFFVVVLNLFRLILGCSSFFRLTFDWYVIFYPFLHFCVFTFYIRFICTAVSGKFNSLIFIVVMLYIVVIETFNQPFGCGCLSWPIPTRFSQLLILCPDVTFEGRGHQALLCPKTRMKKQGMNSNNSLLSIPPELRVAASCLRSKPHPSNTSSTQPLHPVVYVCSST